MKSFKILFFAVLFSVGLLNCSSSDDNANDGEFIRATVETLSFESVNVPDGATAAKIDGGDFITFIVQGFDSAGNIVVIAVPEYDGPGTYSLGNDNGEFSASGLFGNESGTWSSVVAEGNGSVTILTDDDQETTGTFQFVGVNSNDESSTRTITNGSFRVKF